MEILGKLSVNYYYLTATILFIIGLHTMLTHSNLVKKIIGLNIMETAVFLMFVSIGYIRGGYAPIVEEGSTQIYMNPLPQALILTGIVVAVSITAFALSLIIKLYQHYGTCDAEEIARIRSYES